MTRSTLKRALRRVYALLVLVLGISLLAKVADHMPVLAGSGLEKFLKDIYEYLRDMSLLIATGGVAYITNLFQKRSGFVEALKEEWRDIIATKSALFAYTQLERPTAEQYIATFCKLSETIDNMRSVYQNVGETRDLIGLYPYAPLHDMRRALQTLDPRKNPNLDAQTRNLVRDAILQSFYALRETFLEELDLEEPDHPLLISSGRRAKRSGSTSGARRAQDRQRARQDRSLSPDPRIDELLAQLYAKENTTAKPWRQPVGAAVPSPAGHGA
ncbi:MAG TPA: hypothetical protein VFI48_10810 [Hyphomicrobiaceae bacterium]|jgi:hypothetical protein|nr:hypothetical protein [Hyphomicrobiaceae bacterium]